LEMSVCFVSDWCAYATISRDGLVEWFQRVGPEAAPTAP
jgi:hypothetical protein